jgi:DNA-binding LacI/PurR family transcriptional regulator
MAMGALDALKEAGLKIPGDVAVVRSTPEWISPITCGSV